MAAMVLPAAPTMPQQAAPSTGAAALPPMVVERFEQIIEIQADGSSSLTSTQILRPMTPQVAQSMSAFPIPVSKSLQLLDGVEGYVEDAAGNRTPIDPKTIITQAPPYAAEAMTLSDVELKVLPLPRVEVGGRVARTLRMRQTTPYFPGNYFFSVVDLPWLPRKSGTLTVSAPASLPLRIENEGWTEAAPEIVDGRATRRFSRTAGPYVPARSDAVSPIDWAPRLLITTFADWAALAKAYQDRATPKEVATPEIAAMARSIVAGAKTEREKATRIVHWVRDNIRYVNIVLGEGGFVPAAAEDTFAKRFGDCKGHVTLTNTMLRSVGIDSTTAIVSLRDTYREPTVAANIFNHVIVYIPTLDAYADTTGRFLDFGELAGDHQGKLAILTRTGTTKRLPIDNVEPDGEALVYDLTIAPDGTISGTSRYDVTGAERIGMRAKLAVLPTIDRAADVARVLANNRSPGTGTMKATPDGKGIEARFTLSTPLVLDGPGGFALPYTYSPSTMLGATRVSRTDPPLGPWRCGQFRLSETFRLRFPDTV
ncbi:MAG: DUF3857 domain-containing protein, partial [Alphaproteobacteria bacterium]|nr:DUF3857 domain-containing protein [Alphaproteobacteria bacterium]